MFCGSAWGYCKTGPNRDFVDDHSFLMTMKKRKKNVDSIFYFTIATG